MERKEEMVLAMFVLLSWGSSFIEAGLQMGFYSSSCPQAEMVVRSEVNMALRNDVGFAAGLVRMQFHDCFVRGCDGSVLLDSTPTNKAEKDSPVNNPSLRGFEVIDRVKARLEAACKGTVSCADILAFAARDSIAFTGGFGYPVLGGRRDGRVSILSETFSNLPSPNSNLSQLTQSFANKGFSQDEMVTLSGAHTIGRAHCNTISNRLYNFSATNQLDPSLEPSLATQLKQQCPQGNNDKSAVVPMNLRSSYTFDSSYYSNVLAMRGLFTSDEALLTDPMTANRVMMNAFDNSMWQNQFSRAMFKLSQLGVITGTGGEIRLNCRVIN
ncbi:peroxidase 5 [Dendrobium catenatum]|uniref:Peroxidase n=1 Tax=Dendrobium catenatum TaxID=906689 RepID=A0A2I0X5H9_9ASPA|nr:peroxidase 5 [Dendrobium catenatum]PKU83153.1 Peroxidase 5 [Dendrobium catenatum]